MGKFIFKNICILSNRLIHNIRITKKIESAFANKLAQNLDRLI